MDYLPNGKPFRRRHVYVTETLRIMRLAAILLFAACLQVSARGYTQGKVSLSEKEASLDKVFKDIQKQTGYSFMYQKEMLTDAKKITFDVQDASLEEVLQLCFKDQPLTYSIISNLIVIQKKKPNSIHFDEPPLGEIRGTVSGEDGSPIASATITVKGTKIIALADAKGEFVLKNIDQNSVLIISSVGYDSYEISLKGRSSIIINLKRKIGELDEMQVIAYGTVSRRLNTGDVTTIKGEDITEQPVTNPLLALEGRVPGLYIQQYSGLPGGQINSIQLRGQNSVAQGNDPLFIIDGVPYPSTSLITISGAAGAISPLNSINTSDIESIEVLKDADATAIYGSRGANGVILITTRTGKSGSTKFDVNVYSGSGKVTRTVDLMNTKEYLSMRHEAFENDGVLPHSYDYDINGTWDTTRYTNWQKTLFGGSAKFTNAQASLSGGNSNTQFLIDGGYSKQTTVFPGDFYDQLASVHMNLMHTSTNKRFNGIINISYVNDDNKMPGGDITSSISLPPDAPALYDQFANLNWQNNTFSNPLAVLLKLSNAVTDNLVGNANLSYLIIPGLKLKANLGYNLIQMTQYNFKPLTSFNPSYADQTYRETDYGVSGLRTWIAEPQIEYLKSFRHSDLNAIVGTTFQQNNQNAFSEVASDFTSDQLLQDLSAAASISNVVVSQTLYRYNAFFGRLNYSLNKKYLFNITGRRDGSSRFGPSKQFGNFGAVGAGWIFSKEGFISDHLHFLSFGKIRGNYGLTGNDQITDYQYLSTYTAYSSGTYQNVTGLYPTQLANPTFGWEVVKKAEIGVDLGFLKDKILFSGNYYRNRTGNQLVGYTLPEITGFTSIQSNLPAIVQNSGYEFTLNTSNLNTKQFTWATSFNISFPENKLVSYPNLSSSGYANTYAIGKPLFIRFLYHYTGVDPQTGIYAFETKNSNGRPSYPQDLHPLKQIAKQYFGGFRNKLQLQQWQLDFFFQFVKQTANNYLGQWFMPGTMDNQPALVQNRWQKEGDQTSIEKYSESYGSSAYQAFSNVRESNYSISDASFIRLKTVSLSYQITRAWLQKLKVAYARLYIQGQNLLTITKYLGDPETTNIAVVPPLRMITAGIQLTL